MNFLNNQILFDYNDFGAAFSYDDTQESSEPVDDSGTVTVTDLVGVDGEEIEWNF